MKEVNENYTCGLELEGGYHGHPYPQKFVKAKSEHPYPCNYSAQEMPKNTEVMKITMGK